MCKDDMYFEDIELSEDMYICFMNILFLCTL